MTNATVYVVTEQILTDNITSVSAFSTLDKARAYVRSAIEEYDLDGADVCNDGLNWWDEALNYFDILISKVDVL